MPGIQLQGLNVEIFPSTDNVGFLSRDVIIVGVRYICLLRYSKSSRVKCLPLSTLGGTNRAGCHSVEDYQKLSQFQEYFES